MDKSSYKVLRYIDRHPNILEPKLFEKFSKLSHPSIAMIVGRLNSDEYIYMRIVNDKVSKSTDTLISITIAGKEALENYSPKRFSDKFARIMSVIAVVIALASLLISILGL